MPHDYDLGVQSVVYDGFTVPELAGELDRTGIRELELWGAHLDHGDDAETVAAARGALDDAGISVCGHGVVDLDEPGEARPHFAFADELGADYVTVNYPPAADAVTEELIDLAEEFGLDACIHNYSTVHHDDLSTVFSSVEDVRSVLEEYEHDRLGLCVDTGHFLVMETTPDEVLPELGHRVNAVHLKDTSEAAEEDAPGAETGTLDLPGFLDLLDEHADIGNPLVIEYELPAADATPALKDAEARIRSLLTG